MGIPDTNQWTKSLYIVTLLNLDSLKDHSSIGAPVWSIFDLANLMILLMDLLALLMFAHCFP